MFKSSVSAHNFTVSRKMPARRLHRKLSETDRARARPKAALLFWFFGDFRCGALLFMVIHVIYKYKNK